MEIIMYGPIESATVLPMQNYCENMMVACFNNLQD